MARYRITQTRDGQPITDPSEFATFDLVLRELIEDGLPNDMSIREAVEHLRRVSAEKGGVMELPHGIVITVQVVE